MHILRFEKNCMFSTQIYIKKSARSLRSLAILSTFSPLSNASSFNKAIYHGGPLDPTRMRKIACFRHTHTIGLIAIIYNSFFSSFWSVCKTFFRRKSTQILARSISFFSSFLCSSQYNKQDHITSVTNTVMYILYRQTVIYQQCIYWDLRSMF